MVIEKLTHDLGRSCSLSILSRTGIDWIKSKTGETQFLDIISTGSNHDDPWTIWRPDVFHDLFSSQVYKPLPSRAEVFSLIKDFFRTANRLFPMYHEASFMQMVEWQYTQQTCDDAARWASINMVICLAYEYRFSNNMKPEKDREKARYYFKNAMSVFTDLSLRRTDLLSVQALLSMVRRPFLLHPRGAHVNIALTGLFPPWELWHSICTSFYHRRDAVMSTHGITSEYCAT